MVRVSNTGVTAMIDPTGRVTESLPEMKEATGVFEARTLGERTVFSMIGDHPWWFVVVLAGLARFVAAKTVRGFVNRKREGGSTP